MGKIGDKREGKNTGEMVRFDTLFEMKLRWQNQTQILPKKLGETVIFWNYLLGEKSRMMHTFTSWSIIGVYLQQIGRNFVNKSFGGLLYKNIIHVSLWGTPGGHGLALREGVVGDRHAEVPPVHHHGQGGTAV